MAVGASRIPIHMLKLCALRMWCYDSKVPLSLLSILLPCRDVKDFNPEGAGRVTAQVSAGPWETFRIHKLDSDCVAIVYT